MSLCPRTVHKELIRSSFVLCTLVCILLSGCAGDRGPNPLADLLAGPANAVTKTESTLKPPIQPPGKLTAVESVKQLDWHTSWEEAREEAEQTGKLILADFTGSDWCHWCVKLKKDRFQTPEFQSWAKDNVVLLELDFPRNSPQPMAVKIQNRNLKEQYGINSYPTVLLLKPDGSVQAKMGYESGKSPTQWVQLAESRLQKSMEARYVADSSGQSATVVR